MDRGYEFDKSIKLELKSNSTEPSPHHYPSNIILAGVDEVGRGPLAGPVVAAAVVLPETPLIPDLNDSKLLSPKKRETLYDLIQTHALGVTVSIIENEVVDSINILAAALKAMRNAIGLLQVKPHLVLVDGNQKPASGLPERAIIKGDTLSASIMAASIIAKVTRDRIMVEAHEKYPQYGFNGHKGYGSSQHLAALRTHGPCPLHRKSFSPVRDILEQAGKTKDFQNV